MNPKAALLRNFVADGMLPLLPVKRSVHPGKESLLLVRLDAIGDFVLWLDAARTIRRLYPPERYRLVLLGNDLWTELAAYQPCFDEVIPFNIRRSLTDLRYRLSVWRKLRSTAWVVAINPTFSRQFPFDDAAIRICGARQRIGFQSDLSNQRWWELKISNRWYSRLIPPVGERKMELQRNADFVRALGLPQFRASQPQLTLPGEAVCDEGGKRYFVVVPGASLPLKQWPLENFAQLVQRVWDNYGLRAVICGAPNERQLGVRLQRLLADSVTVECRCGDTSLPDFAALIRGARFVLGNDSSAIHIAAAVGTKSFCLVGGGHYGRFVPYQLEADSGCQPAVICHPMECYQCNLRCPYVTADESAPCLSRITVDDAWNEVKAVLDADSSTSPFS